MLRFLRRFFKGKHPLIAAAKSGQAARFGEELIKGKVIVIHADLGKGLPFSASENELLKIVETAANTAPTTARFFSYPEKGKTYLPFFLSQADADSFCGAYSGRENTLYAYQILEVEGSAILRMSREVDQFVMNDQSDDEFMLSPEWMSTLQVIQLPEGSGVEINRLAVGLPHPSLRR